MANTYTVQKGDTLWGIAGRYLNNNYRWSEIAELNLIDKKTALIYPGQKLNLPGVSSSTTTKKNTSNAVNIEYFGLQAGTDRTMFAAWSWDKEETESYHVKWTYDTGDGVWFIGSNNEGEKEKQSLYSAPTNAKRARLVVKPLAKKNGTSSTASRKWEAKWSTAKIYDFSHNPPTEPPVPTVSLNKDTLMLRLDNLDVNADKIEFQIYKDSVTFSSGPRSMLYKSQTVPITKLGNSNESANFVSFSCKLEAGYNYLARCRSVRGSLKSDYSNFTSLIQARPRALGTPPTLKAISETSISISWTVYEEDNAGSSNNTTAYDIEYATDRTHLGVSDNSMTISSITHSYYIKTGLETGKEYFFRIRAVNNSGTSEWSEIVSIIIGKKPAAPTTWSSTTTGVVGDPLTLYWVHNSEDGSTQTYAEIELYVNGTKELVPPIDSTTEKDEEKTMHYTIDTSSYSEGMKIQWRVRTAGVTKEYGDWSIERTIDIYAPPTIGLAVTNSSNESINTLMSFPFYITGLASPSTQKAIGYHVTITADSSYETVDNMGNSSKILAGGVVYSKYYNASDGPLVLEISASSINLENNIDYTITVTVSMNSGLTATNTWSLGVAWEERYFSPNAEVGINHDDVSAYIRPYCKDENEELVDGVTLSVYRREFDGGFTEIGSNLDNSVGTWVTDPHPSLDYARYRIIAVDAPTGSVSYYDMPGIPVEEKAVVIQWDEAWTSFDTDIEETPVEPPWTGSMLKLPYNIDISDKRSLDTSMIEYIGRKHPVSYYGTHLGETAEWKVEIPKEDKETLYALRRLSVWMGDVYVREPSGSGYWANISVSFSQTHMNLTIPVNISVTRVEGGL